MASNECLVCKRIVQTALTKLGDGERTGVAIKDALAAAPEEFPVVDRSKATDFLAMYGEQLADLIATMDDPETIGSLLGVC